MGIEKKVTFQSVCVLLKTTIIMFKIISKRPAVFDNDDDEKMTTKSAHM